MKQISRNSFARETLLRETYYTYKETCAWCGGVKYTKSGRSFLYRYYIEPDSISCRKNPIKGMFCCKGCMQNYHSL